MKPRSEDLTGKIFGTKKVLEKISMNKNLRWRCECQQCHAITYPDTRALKQQCWCQVRKERDLTGKIFGDRKVIKRKDVTDPSSMNVWVCECIHCGERTFVSTYDLRHGIRTECHHKAVFDETATLLYHGYKTSHPLYKLWVSMKNNCYNPESKYYQYFGARKLEMSEEWYNPEDPNDATKFGNFFKWAMDTGYVMHMMPSGRNCCRLMRIDPDQGYSPDNCEWQFLRAYKLQQIEETEGQLNACES